MNQLDIQRISNAPLQPGDEALQSWINAALSDYDKDTEIVVRIVDDEESAMLNEHYRHKKGSTNILSFPIDLPPGIEVNLLGDLVVCAPVVEREALEQHKSLEHHWAHIIIHGVLHLLGYDHIDDMDAERMETKEIKILHTLNITNPYEPVTDS